MMRRKFIPVICILVCSLCFLFSLNSCYYDNEEDLYGKCDTSNVTYSGAITQILKNYACQNCHSSPPSNGAPFSLMTYADLKRTVDSARLLGAINHLNGYAPMPRGDTKMNQCDIKKVEAWVANGAQEN